jgi:hypothetical protein
MKTPTTDPAAAELEKVIQAGLTQAIGQAVQIGVAHAMQASLDQVRASCRSYGRQIAKEITRAHVEKLQEAINAQWPPAKRAARPG